MAQTGSPLYDPEPADARAHWGVLVRRFFVSAALLPCVLFLAYSVADPEARDLSDLRNVEDLNDLWNVEPVKTLDRLCMPRTFLLSPRTQCSQNLKQIRLSFCCVPWDEGGSYSMEVRDDPVDAPVDATLDHLW
jgi:hypothetical protein